MQTPLTCSDIDHSVTCKQHHICLYSQSQSITALWSVLIVGCQSLVTQSTLYRKLVIRSTHHAVDSSQTGGQLVTARGQANIKSVLSPLLKNCSRKRADNKVIDSARKINKIVDTHLGYTFNGRMFTSEFLIGEPFRIDVQGHSRSSTFLQSKAH